MATLARADISAAMSLILQDPMADQFRRDVPLVHLLTVLNNGKNDTLTWNPKFDGRTAGGAYAEGADMADADYDSHDRAKASLNWAAYRAGAKVSGLAMSVASDGYAGDGMNGDLFDEELVDAIDKIATDVGTDLYAGDPGATPVELAGAALAIDGTASTFATLASSTYGDWLAAENSIASTALNIQALRDNLLRPVKDATGRNPDFVTCPGNLFDDVKDLYEDKAEIVQEIRVRDGMINIMKAAGAEAVMVDGVPFIEDRFCTASTFYSWTARDVAIVQLPAKGPRRNPQRIVEAIKALTGVDVTVTEVEQRMRRSGVVIPTIEFLAQTGDAYKAMVKVYLQLKWRTRNGFAKLTIT